MLWEHLLIVFCSLRLLLITESQHKMSFLLLGDWGKGGTTGQYISALTDNVFIGTMVDVHDVKIENDNRNSIVHDKKLQKESQSNQMSVASAMAQTAATLNPAPSFVVALGDNFYDNGTPSSTDNIWLYNWKDVYISPYTSLDIPWYPVFGNHDYAGGSSAVQAQLDRTTEHLEDDIWTFPATNYSRIFPISDGLGSVAIVFVDTTTLAPSENSCCNENGGISKDEQAARIANQLLHIEDMLSTLTAMTPPPTWLLVAGHYPIFSQGSHGDILELKRYLLPLLLKYKVHAYVCGHDHISEHLQYGSLHAFVAGAGAMTDQLKESSNATLLWSGTGYSAFAAVIASATELNVSFIDSSSRIRYSYVLAQDAYDTSLEPLPPMIPRFGWRTGSKRETNTLLLSLVGVGAVIALVLIAGSGRFTSGSKRFDSDSSKTPSSSPYPQSPASTLSPLPTPSSLSEESWTAESPSQYPIPQHHRQYQYEQQQQRQHRRGGASEAFSSMSTWSQASIGSGFNMDGMYRDVLLEDSNGDLRVVKLLLSRSTEEHTGSSPSSSLSSQSTPASSIQSSAMQESDIEDRVSEFSSSYNNTPIGWQYSPRAGYYSNLRADGKPIDTRPTHFRRFST